MSDAQNLVERIKQFREATPGLFDKRDKVVKDLKQLANKHGAHTFDVGLKNISVGLATAADAKKFTKDVEKKFEDVKADFRGGLFVWLYPGT